MDQLSAFGVLDQIYVDALSRVKAEDHWLLQQTMLTKEKRRELVSALPVSPKDSVLDVGCGFGALAFDIAIIKDAQVVALDISSESIELACWVYERLKGSIDMNAVEFRISDVYDTTLPAGSFDFAVARFVFQHLDNPRRALVEMKRTLKPTGHICLIDIDDQLVIVYPEMEPDIKHMYDQFRKLQELQGGDRLVGRKLAHYLHDCGMEVVATIIQPETQFHYLIDSDHGVQFELERLRGAKSHMLAEELITEEKYEETMQKILNNCQRYEWVTSSQVIVVGRKNG